MTRFFIVEDDAAVGDSLVLFLTQHGHTAKRYYDAETFFGEVVPEAGDTLIIDLALPGMSGRQVVRWASMLREEPAIIVISGQNEASLRRDMEGLSVRRLIRKPLDAESVRSLL